MITYLGLTLEQWASITEAARVFGQPVPESREDILGYVVLLEWATREGLVR